MNLYSIDFCCVALQCGRNVEEDTARCLEAIDHTEAHQDVQRVEQLRDSVCFHTPRRPSPHIVPLCYTVAPTAAPNHRRWCDINFPTRWSHGHASARSRDRAHPAPPTSLQPSSECCFENHQPASRRFPRSTARVLCRCCEGLSGSHTRD